MVFFPYPIIGLASYGSNNANPAYGLKHSYYNANAANTLVGLSFYGLKSLGNPLMRILPADLNFPAIMRMPQILFNTFVSL
jgi:hypothetical protein